MSANAGAVFAGVGQDLVTGTVLSAVYGTPLPVHTTAFFEASLDAAFKDNGYIGEAGVTLSRSKSFTDIKDMDGTVIDTIQTEFNGTIQTNFLELNEWTLKNLLGDANVSVTASTLSTGNRITAAITGEDIDPKSWIFRMKAGLKRVGIIVPQGRLTDSGDLAFTSSGAASMDATIKTIPWFDSGSGKNVNAWVITDDGVFTLSLVPTITSVLPTAQSVGNEIIITGSRFTGTTAITVGGTAVGAVNVKYIIVSDSTIVATMPTGSAGSAPVIVTNPSGASAPAAYTRGA